jgi:VWFA-related protein
MMRPTPRIFVALAALIGMLPLPPDAVRRVAAEQAPLIRAGIDLVHFDVIVTDKRGRVVDGLTAEDFEVVEQGARQTVSVFAVGNRDSPDLHLGILVDVSSSMGELQAVRDITLEVLNRLPEATDYTLVLVGDDADVAHFARRDLGALIARIRAVKRKDGESTALWDGFIAYLRDVAPRPGRHALVAFSDGHDTSSSATFEHVRRSLRASTVTMFGVGFGHSDGSAHGWRLGQLADETGGITMFPHGPDQIAEVHRRLITEVRSQYSLGYVSTDERRDGGWRDVKIRLVHPEHKDLRLRARDGYFAFALATR